MADDLVQAAATPEFVLPGAGTAERSIGERTALAGRPAIGIALVSFSALMFSTGALFVRSLDHPHAWTMVFWRSVAATGALALLVRVRDRVNPMTALVTMSTPSRLVAATFCASSIGMVVALSLTTTAVVLVIFSLSPLMAAVMAWLLIGERVAWFTWAAVLVTVAGVVLMAVGPGATGFNVGALVAFIIPVAFGLGTVTIRRHPNVSATPAMLLAAISGAVIALPFADPLSVNRHDLLILLAFGSCQLGAGLAIFGMGATRIPATDVALYSMLEPVTGPIWVWLWVDEYPGGAALIGGSVVFAALIVHTLYARRVVTN